MKILYTTQSSTLDVFYSIHKALDKSHSLGQAGFYVTDSRYFQKFVSETPGFYRGEFQLIKEWEIIEEARFVEPNMAKLRELEEKLGQPYFWDALIADRRITFGPQFAASQDYRSRYTHRQMAAILEIALERLLNVFDELNPSLVLNFQCLTIGDYLSFLIATHRKIPFINIRPTKMGNFIYAAEDIFEPSALLRARYNELLLQGVPSTLQTQVEKFLADALTDNLKYEGVVLPSSKPPTSSRVYFQYRPSAIRKAVKSVANILVSEYQYRTTRLRFDNSISGFIRPLTYSLLLRPLRARQLARLCTRSFGDLGQLSHVRYAFFPLHPEPEVSLIVYSRPYRNQLEVIRTVAASLPIDMKLVVKEHPWQVGKRKATYFKKLLDIPNVVLAPAALTSTNRVKNAQLVIVIAGSIGLEGLLRRIPVIVLGGTPFGFLPQNMIRQIDAITSLPQQIHDLLANYEFDESALMAYIATVISESVPIDFYSKILGRKGVFSRAGSETTQKFEEERSRQISLLANYIIGKYKKQKESLPLSFPPN